MLLRGLGEHAQHGQTGQEAIGHGPLAQPECDLKRVALGAGKPVEPIQNRHAQLM